LHGKESFSRSDPPACQEQMMPSTQLTVHKTTGKPSTGSFIDQMPVYFLGAK
jgi:hypothetical protein